VVGVTTGRPVLTLDDLIVALRAAAGPNRGPITCSIDPMPEGVRRLHEFLSQQKTIGNPGETIARIEEALGLQQITVSGVPETTRFARVMVAADYRMKRLAMGFDEPPVRGLPSFLQLAPASVTNLMPRWWLSDNYEVLLTDADSLAFELRGQGVKAQTEDELVTAEGERRGTGQANPIAAKWADNMTAKYEDLAARDAIFGQLRNCMDLAVVSALIYSEDLPAKSGCSLEFLVDPKNVTVGTIAASKHVPSKVSYVKKGSNWLLSASGGVMIDPWKIVAEKRQQSETLTASRADAVAPEGAAWWW
jgi:hypothetical protein